MIPAKAPNLPYFGASILVAALSSPLIAQTQAPAIPHTQAQGMFTGHPVGAQVTNVAPSTTPPPVPRLQVRTPGLQSGSLRTWSTEDFGPTSSQHPDYSPSALFSHWTTSLLNAPPSAWDDATAPFVPVFGGMSTGGDVTPEVSHDGTMQASSTLLGWYALSWTVDHEAVGQQASSIEIAGPSPAGWVFSHTFEGSEGIRSLLIDNNRVEYTRFQMGLSATPAQTEEITSLDWGMGLISATPNSGPTSLQPVRDCFYFTIDSEWIQAYYPGGSSTFTGLSGSGTPVQIPLDAGTVYAMTWNGSTWSAPMIAFDHVALYGSVQTNVALDALSVFRLPGDAPDQPTRVVFSLTADSTLDGQEVNQILVSQRSSSSAMALVTAEPLKSESGTQATTKLGLVEGGSPTLGADDIKSLCGRDPRLDPDFEPLPGTPQTFDSHQGTPLDIPLDLDANELGLSMLLYQPQNGQEQQSLLLTATGIDLSGYDLGLIEFDFAIAEPSLLPIPLQQLNFFTAPPILVLADSQSAEFSFPYEPLSSVDLRAQARVHGFRQTPLAIDINIAQTWELSLGN